MSGTGRTAPVGDAWSSGKIGFGGVAFNPFGVIPSTVDKDCMFLS
jgi:hypothetical protein